jgi:TRAP transporter 4TM/12TM fusion protein
VYDQLKRFEQIVFDLLSVLLVLFYSYAAIVQPASTEYHRGIYVIITYVLIFLHHIYYKQEGVFGIMATVLVTYVILFIFFGSFLKFSGTTPAVFFWICPWPWPGARWATGPAKVAVMASGFFGSVSGSAIANTVSTGAFTIPLMKKAGFKPHVAGAIEPAASIGGMFMPPIMGAGGFIMAEMTGIPYVKIMLMAVFPAAIYFLSVFVMVHFEAKMYNIVGERSEHSAMEILRKEWFYALPLIVITIFMLAGYSPGYAAILGMATCIIVSYKYDENHIDKTLAVITVLVVVTQLIALLLSKTVGHEAGRSFTRMFSEREMVVAGIVLCFIWYVIKKERRPAINASLKRFLDASRSGTENSLKIGATIGVIGIIIGVLTYTGLILTFADIVIELAGGSLVLTILFIALASLVLGMGVPVTAAYLITAVVAVPALTHLGINPIASHMIVYWLSQDSNITPPVCIAAFAGATIAKANMWRTAFASFKFAKFLYLGPFLFGYVPAFSLDGSAMDIIKAFVLITIATYVYAYLLSGIWIKNIRGWFSKASAV